MLDDRPMIDPTTLRGGIAGAVLLITSSAAAAPTIYTSRAEFETAFPGLSVERFEGLASNAGCPSPITRTTPSNACFNQDTLRPGFSIGGTASHPTDGISLSDGPTGRFIGTSYYADTTVLTLEQQPVVGFDMHLVGGGAVTLSDGTTATVTVYDPLGTLVATQDVPTGGFFGIRSDTNVATVRIFRSGVYDEGIDNLVFGPLFSSVSPTGGYRGGSTVTLTGEGLAAGTTVAFDGVPATDVVVSGGTSLTCKAPAHATGTVDVALQTSGVTLTRAASFTYVAHVATVALSVTPKAPRYDDESNTFTVAVTGTDPTGVVALMEDARELTQGAIIGDAGAQLDVPLEAGAHKIFARYKGDPFHPETDSNEVAVDVEARPSSSPGIEAGASSPPATPGTDAGVRPISAPSGRNAESDESGCSAASDAPRFGAATVLMLFSVLVYVRRQRAPKSRLD
jgi:hypothetical protein